MRRCRTPHPLRRRLHDDECANLPMINFLREAAVDLLARVFEDFHMFGQNQSQSYGDLGPGAPERSAPSLRAGPPSAWLPPSSPRCLRATERSAGRLGMTGFGLETCNFEGRFGPVMAHLGPSGPYQSLSFALLHLTTIYDSSVAHLGTIFGNLSASDRVPGLFGECPGVLEKWDTGGLRSSRRG